MAGPYLNTGAFATKITATNATPQEELGIWRFEAAKILRYVKAGSAVIPAYEAVKQDTAVTGATIALVGNQVVQTSSPTDLALGIAEVTLAANNYGWITCYGPATARVVGSGGTGEQPGAALGPSTNTGVLSIRNSSHFNAAAIAVASGLSAGSAVFVRVL